MHIRVIPAYPQPEIVFTFSMPDPMHDDSKPCPEAWHSQLEKLEAWQEQGLSLDFPRDIHALDKATWHTALVNEITFDAARRTITCLFVDGFTLSWPMASTGRETRCLAALEEVSAAVRRYTRVEQPSRKYWVADQPLSSVPEVHHHEQSETSSMNTGSQRSKHRRQRSFLGSIVSAFKTMLPDNLGRNSGPILPSSLPPLRIPPASGHARSSSTFSRTQLSPPTSPTVTEFQQQQQSFTLVIRPRQSIPLPEGYVPPDPNQALRRFARSLMLDVIREHVYPILSTTGPPSFVEGPQTLEWAAQVAGFPPGRYPAWAARSMLRQTEERLREMTAEANARGLGNALASGALTNPLPSRQSLRSSDDSDDTNSASTTASATSLSTETDGSSVHTPVDSPACSPFVPASTSFPHLPGLESKALPQVPRSPSPPPYDFDVSTYHALTTLRSRLFALLSSLSSTPRQIHNLQQGMWYGSDMTIVEIKSRRRAWSCRDFVGRASLSLVGLATPVRSSPLARCEPVTAESLARAQVEAVHASERPRLSCLPDEGAEFGLPGACGGVRVMTKELDSRLFSLSEEDEEDEDESQDGYESGYGSSEYIEDGKWREDLDDDLESGLLAFPRPEPVNAPASTPYSFPHSQSHPMVRPRTQSMLKERTTLSPSPSEPYALSHKGGGLSPDSLLCQPFEVKVPILLDDDDSLVSGPAQGSEFTLAMDLPSPFSPSPPPRGWAGENMGMVRARR